MIQTKIHIAGLVVNYGISNTYVGDTIVYHYTSDMVV